jgi:subtilisin family serine protease
MIAAGIVWAVDHGARVVNLSLGGPGDSPQLAAAAAYAVHKGAVVVAAAGNSGTTVPFYPAADPNAISVAGTTAADRAYSWSNFGSWVDVAAPGCNIAPVLGGGYGNFCGTSSAAPVVTGLVALEASLVPNATPGEIQSALQRGAVALPGFVQYGRIDAPATLSLVRTATLPASPVQVQTVLRGTLDAHRLTRTYAIAAGAGPFTAALVFRGARTLTLTLTRADGVSIARIAGPGPLRLDRTLDAGPVKLVVRGGARRASFRLTVGYVRAAP